MDRWFVSKRLYAGRYKRVYEISKIRGYPLAETVFELTRIVKMPLSFPEELIDELPKL